MGETLLNIANDLKNVDKKVQLIYAFNGTGKTRLSRIFKDLLVLEKEDAEGSEFTKSKYLYYNAFTEDLFYWDNDFERKLKIHKNNFTDWILKNQGQDQNIITNFQKYVDNKLMPSFNLDFTEVKFSLKRGDDEEVRNLKISKGEESNFIWSFFYTLLEQVITVLNEEDSMDDFNELRFVFIDDPVSSLDENHVIELAVELAELIKLAPSYLKFIISTHNPLFYNVLYGQLKNKKCYFLEKREDGLFNFLEKEGGTNQSFSYHLHLKKIIENAIENNEVEKFHFTLLRNLYEKTASFLGYEKWQDLLDTIENDKAPYLKRIINFSSHRKLSGGEIRYPTEQEKKTVKVLLDHLVKNYGYWSNKETSNA